MPYKGAIAGGVVLGVVTAAGLPPLAADRARGAVAEVVTSADGAVELWARYEKDIAVVGIRGGDDEWLSGASAALCGYEPAVVEGELRLAFRRSPLRTV